MKSKLRISILGIGGVGGYYGGKLAGRYSSSDETEILFVAKGENETAIRSQGLKLITPDGEQLVHPKIVTSRPADLGIVDFVLCCVKGYDLENALESVKPCVTEETVILPLLNGVNASEKIRTIMRNAEVWEGCAYLISRLIAPGVVQASGNISKFFLARRMERQKSSSVWKSCSNRRESMLNVLTALCKLCGKSFFSFLP